MNKLQKLAQLNRDIELLENAGKFKAAEILQKKFVKEAQAKPFKELMTEFNTLAQNPNKDFEQLLNWYNYNKLSYSEDEQKYIDAAIDKASARRQNQGTFTTSVQPSNPTLPTTELNSTATPVNGQMFAQGLGDAAKAQQQAVFNGLGNAISQPVRTDGDNANEMQALNTNPNAQQESIEQKVYMNALNNIINALKYDDINTVETQYKNTINFFKNPRRKEFFEKQIQRLKQQYSNKK